MSGGQRMQWMEAGRATAILVATIAMASCRDLGLQGNIPLAEAENRQFRYSTYELSDDAARGARMLPFEARNWIASAAVEVIPDRLLREVGEAAGTTLYAPVWAETPYVRLYARAEPGRWHPILPVP
jgi:hypothetical protein